MANFLLFEITFLSYFKTFCWPLSLNTGCWATSTLGKCLTDELNDVSLAHTSLSASAKVGTLRWSMWDSGDKVRCGKAEGHQTQPIL